MAQALIAFGINARVFCLGPVFGQCAFRLAQRRFKRRPVNHEEKLSFFNKVPFFEMDAHQLAGNLRLDAYRGSRFHVADGLQLHRHGT